jgi:uncharacterized protein DUF4347
MTNRREPKKPLTTDRQVHDADAASISGGRLPMSASTSHKREIAFIDSGVEDLQTLLKGIRLDVEPILLTAEEPAPRQMARAVKGREGLEAIHVIAHGRPGEVTFSAGALTEETIVIYANDLATVGSAVAPDGQLSLWACSVADDVRGTNFR